MKKLKLRKDDQGPLIKRKYLLLTVNITLSIVFVFVLFCFVFFYSVIDGKEYIGQVQDIRSPSFQTGPRTESSDGRVILVTKRYVYL